MIFADVRNVKKPLKFQVKSGFSEGCLSPSALAGLRALTKLTALKTAPCAISTLPKFNGGRAEIFEPL
jgi:hypothetical protein